MAVSSEPVPTLAIIPDKVALDAVNKTIMVWLAIGRRGGRLGSVRAVVGFVGALIKVRSGPVLACTRIWPDFFPVCRELTSAVVAGACIIAVASTATATVALFVLSLGHSVLPSTL